jgi:hypothetical protein
MCLIALNMTKEVKFAAVIDNNGKLIAGKQRNDYVSIKLTKTRLLQLSSTKALDKNADNFCSYNKNHFFYTNYLTSAMKRIKKDIKRLGDSGDQESIRQYIELAEIHGILKIAITPLTASNDRYLCIYLETSSPNQEILAKISDAF